MAILPEPACFTKQEYNRFKKAYPHAQEILAASFRHTSGETTPLVRDAGDRVYVYVGLLSPEQEQKLGAAALQELRRHLPQTGNFGKRRAFLILGLVMIVVLGGLIIGGNWAAIKDRLAGLWPSPTPTQIPEPTPSPAPTQTPEPTPSPAPTQTPEPTPIPKPTQMPTPSPAPSFEKVVLQNTEGFFIEPFEGKYLLKPGEQIRVTVNPDTALPSDVRLEMVSVRGEIRSDGVYRAPDRPGTSDLVTLKMMHQDTGNTLAQYPIMIRTTREGP